MTSIKQAHGVKPGSIPPATDAAPAVAAEQPVASREMTREELAAQNAELRKENTQLKQDLDDANVALSEAEKENEELQLQLDEFTAPPAAGAEGAAAPAAAETTQEEPPAASEQGQDLLS